VISASTATATPLVAGARSLFLAGAALLALYLFGLRGLTGVTNTLLLAFAGVVFGVALDLFAGPLSRRLPRAAAVVLVLALFGAGLYLLVRTSLPVLGRQFATLASQIPAGAERLWSTLRASPVVGPALPGRLDLSRVGNAALGHLFPFLSGAMAVVSSAGIVVAIGAFTCADPSADLDALIGLVPPRHRERVQQMAVRSATALRRWLGASLLTMAIVGVLTSVGLLAVGVHGWLALGFLAFLGALVPYLGSLVVGIAIAGAGLADSPARALLGVGIYVVIQALLGTVIAPLVSRAVMRTSPTALLTVQVIMGASFGVLGILLAQPLLTVATVMLQTAREHPPGPAPEPSLADGSRRQIDAESLRT
jgi:predicted PurR-regulated permease PerM